MVPFESWHPNLQNILISAWHVPPNTFYGQHPILKYGVQPVHHHHCLAGLRTIFLPSCSTLRVNRRTFVEKFSAVARIFPIISWDALCQPRLYHTDKYIHSECPNSPLNRFSHKLSIKLSMKVLLFAFPEYATSLFVFKKYFETLIAPSIFTLLWPRRSGIWSKAVIKMGWNSGFWFRPGLNLAPTSACEGQMIFQRLHLQAAGFQFGDFQHI